MGGPGCMRLDPEVELSLVRFGVYRRIAQPSGLKRKEKSYRGHIKYMNF